MTTFHPALRLTPSNSPFLRSPSPRSPTKTNRSEEPGLHLKKVNGTTTASANGFDYLPSARRFAYTAGAAAVVATIDDELNVKQNFFRANPSSGTTAQTGNNWPHTPTPNEPRHRAVGNLKDQNAAGSPASVSGRDWADSPGKTTSAKDRVKAATSVALSPNGKWLAVGETGYRPRILIFSVKEGSSETPVSILAEHTFGVHALSFSPDSRSLASLGTVNDGFLYVWNMDDRTGVATLSASNKCTTTVNSMQWMGRSIVTVGLRFIKVWRPEDDTIGDNRAAESLRSSIIATPRPKLESRQSDFGNSILSPKHRALAGKNSLLGDLLDATFTCVLPIADSKAIICADTGEICLLDDSDRMQTLTLAVNAGFRITAARLDEMEMLHAVGPDGNTATFIVPDLEKRARTSGKGSRRSSGSPTKISTPAGTTAVAIATVGNAVVEIDSNRVIRLTEANADPSADNALPPRQLPAHEDAVLGVCPFRSSTLPDAAFYTFSGNGTVHFWNEDGISVAETLSVPVDDSPEMYGLPNELKAVATLADGAIVASGDKYGTVALVDISTRQVLHQVRAHSAEVLDVLAFERNGIQFLASASRDRTVQLFTCSSGKLELLQTMDEHAGAVTSLLLSRNGDRLLSCSADRSVVVRQCMLRDPDDLKTMAFVMLRAITLKASPTSMCLTSQDDAILISTVDRCIGKYSTKSGHAGFSFKCSDNDGGEAVVMSRIVYSPSLNGNPTIAGVSSSDKSVRLYSEYGSLIARDWGHTEGVTDIAFISTLATGKSPASRSPRIVSVAADSTVFMWDSIIDCRPAPPSSHGMDAVDAQHGAPLTTLGPPLRKVISHSEMSRFRRDKSTDEQEPPSPLSNITAVQPASPQKLRKKTSRISMAQTPRLESANRPNFDPSWRRSLRQRSPSPPSPKNPSKKDLNRQPSLGMSLKSKSSENVLHSSSAMSNSTGFGTLTSSTESVCRTLRAYRKKLSGTSLSDSLAPDVLRELEKELKLTARVIGEKSQMKNLDEAIMTKLLDQASDKIVGLLDEKIKERVEVQVRKSGDGSSTSSFSAQLDPPAELDEHVSEHINRSETAPGTLQIL